MRNTFSDRRPEMIASTCAFATLRVMSAVPLTENHIAGLCRAVAAGDCGMMAVMQYAAFQGLL